jgi:HEAT repeat protein
MGAIDPPWWTYRLAAGRTNYPDLVQLAGDIAMKVVHLVTAGLCLGFALPASSQAPKGTQPTKDDLPNVSLVVPEDARPEVKAIIKANVISLRSTRASERLKAAHVLGELGEAGKPVRGLLCRAMLDPVPAVRVAAADALKSIDSRMQYLAVTLTMETEPLRLRLLLGKIQQLEDDGEPLAPLVAHGLVRSAARNNDDRLVIAHLEALSHIARNDPVMYRLVASSLANEDAHIRGAALRGLSRMKHGKLAVRNILKLLKTDSPANVVAAIETLTALADASTEEVIADAIRAQRYHEAERVRNAVDTALNKLKNKEKP